MPNQSTLAASSKLLIALFLGFGAFLLTGLFTQSPSSKQNLADYCALSTKSCKQHGAVVTLSDDIIHPMQGADLQVSWPSLPKNTDSLLLSLEGHEMMMGVYQLQLSQSAHGHFSGELLLPFCTSKSMTWKGTIEPIPTTENIKPIYVSLRMIK